MGLSRFTLFAVLRRYDEDPEQESLERSAWNQLGADLLAHVAALSQRIRQVEQETGPVGD